MTDLSLLQDFVAETVEHLEDMEGNLLQLETHPDHRETLNHIFRSVHTIKGAAEYLGMERIAALSHQLENLLDILRRNERPVTREIIDLLMAGRDRIGLLTADLQQGQPEQTDIADLLDRIRSAESPEEGSAPAAAPEATAGDTYTEEHDEELFGIFLEQLQEGLDALHAFAGALAQADRSDRMDILGRCLETLEPLRASANYMGYGNLTARYDRWLDAIREAQQRLGVGDEDFMDGFLADDMQANLAAIAQAFPRLKSAVESPAEETDADLFSFMEADTAVAAVPSPVIQGNAAAPVTESGDPTVDLFPDEDPPEEVGAPAAGNGETIDSSLIQDFITESLEHLAAMEGGLLRLEADPFDAEILKEIFRVVHTIKGAAEYMGMPRIAELSHELESLLDRMRQGGGVVNRGVIDLLMACRDRLGTLVADLHQTRTEQAEIDDLLFRLGSLAAEPAGVDAGEAATRTAEEIPDRDIYEEDYDQELFGIFLEQLREGLEALQSWTEALADSNGPEQIGLLQNCLAQIDPLRSSANYMGYRRLTALYDQWSEAVRTAGERLERGEKNFMPAFVAGCMRATMEDIHRCFPVLRPKPHQGEPSSADVRTQEAPASDLLEAYAERSPSPADPFPAPEPGPDSFEGDALFERLSRSFDRRMAEDRQPDPEAAPAGLEWALFSGEAPDSPPMADSRLPEPAGGPAPDTILPTPSGDRIRSASAAAAEADGETAAPVDASSGSPVVIAAEDSQQGTACPTFPGPTPADDPNPSPETTAPAVPQNPITAAPKERPVPGTERSSGERRDPGEPGRRKSDRIGEQLMRQSIRVDAGKIDALMNQVGELVVSRAWFSQLFHEMRELQQNLQHHAHIDPRDMKQVKGLTFRLSEATVALGRVANELQEGVMKVRMLPIAQLFNRYPRLVFDLVREGGKQVRLDIQGEDTELDKMVIEAISDPLIHILRNAVDHGIETAEERRRLGKSESGTIHLEAYHEGNHVVIEVADDGRGLDLERIKAKALDGGFVTADDIERLSDKELTALIMQPGFSTAAEITHTSGRGVGMDVVKQNIEKLNGTIDIDSTPGMGTQIRIKIPLTLAIIPALLVQVGGELFTIPLSTVEETIRIAPRDISTIEGVEVMQLREGTLPLVRLAELFNMGVKPSPDGRAFVVVVSTGMKRVGLVVDALQGQEEVVIKPLEDYLQEKSGFSGATILGDGRISLILDIYELVNLSIVRQSRRKQVAASA